MAIEALYLHIPFCRSKCQYCDFDSRALCGNDCARSVMSDYVDLLCARLARFGSAGALKTVRTVYIGGGTPSLLGDWLIDLVREVMRWCSPLEFTCEANPESFTLSLAEGLTTAGVTRISLGVQSLIDDELAQIGRMHSAQEALDALHCAQGCGLDVSADLMCGLPTQTMESWKECVQGVILAAPNHVSVYPLTVEEGTRLYARMDCGELPWPDEDLQADQMDFARNALVTAGFESYEVASYAKPGHACAHNIAYWTGVEYLGIGRSAASMLTECTFKNLSSLFPSTRGSGTASLDSRVRLVQLDDSAKTFDVERLSAREAMAEDLMLACRMTQGISAELLLRAQSVIPISELTRACGIAVDKGLARWDLSVCGNTPAHTTACGIGDGVNLVPTHTGWLEGNELFGLFWDLAR